MSTPPFAMPPLSWICTVTVASAVRIRCQRVRQLAARVDGRLDAEERVVVVGDGKSSVCAASFAGPALMAVAQPPRSAAPASSSTV